MQEIIKLKFAKRRINIEHILDIFSGFQDISIVRFATVLTYRIS
jgi:hypothetical protein